MRVESNMEQVRTKTVNGLIVSGHCLLIKSFAQRTLALLFMSTLCDISHIRCFSIVTFYKEHCIYAAVSSLLLQTMTMKNQYSNNIAILKRW